MGLLHGDLLISMSYEHMTMPFLRLVVANWFRTRVIINLFNLHFFLTSLVAEFRAGIMYTSDDNDINQPLKSNMFSLSGTGFFGAVGRSINLGNY